MEVLGCARAGGGGYRTEWFSCCPFRVDASTRLPALLFRTEYQAAKTELTERF
jgi:hypothetical protein